MAKSDLTRKIEKSLFSWYPVHFAGKKVDTFRKGFGATEVPVENGTVCDGLIDYARVQECYIQKSHLTTHSETKASHSKRKESYVIDAIIVCVEIKISLSDFNSKHGHNFVGNVNYYAIPAKLYPKIKDKVPPDIGVLLYYSGPYFWGIRKKKEAGFRELSVEKQKWMILAIAKRSIKYLREQNHALKSELQEKEPPVW